MNVFQENYCRICTEFFCCKTCRLEHEQNHHGIHPECNICIYGTAFLKKPTTSLLVHWKAAHWPLHCLKCKTLFTTTADLKLHGTCSQEKGYNQENSNMFVTAESSVDVNYDSPPITAIMHKSILTSSNKYFCVHSDTVSLTTSTPMQKSNEQEVLKSISEVITPVDYPEKVDTEKFKSKKAIKSNITPITEQLKNTEHPLKRKVTFCETPIINIKTPNHSKKYRNSSSYKINSELKQAQFSLISVAHGCVIDHTGNSINESPLEECHAAHNSKSTKSRMFVTASEDELLEKSADNAAEYANEYNTDFQQSYESTHDTLWESALIDQNTTKPEILSLEVNTILTQDIVCPQMTSNLTESEIISSEVEDMETKSQISSSAIDLNLSAEENLSLKEKVELEISSITDDKNQVISNISWPPMNYNITALAIVSPTIKQTLTETKIPLVNYVTQSSNIFPPAIANNLTQSNTVSAKNEQTNNDILGQQLEFSTTSEQVYFMNINSACTSTSQKTGIWSSMTNLLKSMVQNISGSSQALNESIVHNSIPTGSNKRSKPEFDAPSDESPVRKKLKLAHIECRKTIRSLRPFYELKYGRKMVQVFDKWTQTD